MTAQPKSYHIGIEKGLPANHVYFLMEDRHGYLWMATEQGVIKYNGYSLKTYGLKEGLADEHVWYLFEDKKDRIWLASFGDAIGYIRNDVVHIPYVNKVSTYLRPLRFYNTEKGIICISQDKPNVDDAYFEFNDSFYLFERPLHKSGLLTYSTIDQTLSAIQRNGLYKISSGIGGVREELVDQRLSIYSFPVEKKKFFFQDYMVYESAPGLLTVCNLRNGSRRNLFMYHAEQEQKYVNYARETEKKFYVVTNKHVFVYNDVLAKEKQYSLDSLLNGVDTSHLTVINLLSSKLWGDCIATNKGVNLFLPFIQPGSHKPELNPVTTLKIDEGYANSPFADEHVFLPLDKRIERFQANYQLNKVFNTVKTGDSLLIFSDKRPYWFNARGLPRLTDYLKGIKAVGSQELDGSIVYQTNIITAELRRLRKGMYLSGNLYYLLTGGGFFKTQPQRNQDTLIVKRLSGRRRYTHFIYDSVHRFFCIWGDRGILLYRDDDHQLNIEKNILENAGIKKVKQVLIDDLYGNVFILSQDKLLIYNFYNHRFKEIFSDFNLEGAQASLYNQTLVVAGRFGVLCCKSVGKLNLTNSVHYRNIKDQKYTRLHELYFVPPAIFLNTDKGYYKAMLPNNSSFKNATAFKPGYRFLLKYKDSVRAIHSNDTVQINQNNLLMQFDVINPQGSGDLSFQYRIKGVDDNWKNLLNDQLYLPQLEASRYYELKVIATDAVWHSPPLNLVLYYKPFWWQTATGRTIVWTSIMISFGIFLLGGIAAVNRINKRKHIRRTLQLELQNLRLNTDLKSIYAQINPHFIFNTLSTTAYFIRKNRNKEATAHIIALSGLLRSYIRSTRERTITITEEIAHLENYITLQLARFENKFSYTISVDKAINIYKEIPPLLLQPLVENAIIHGLMHLEFKGLLQISFIPGNNEEEILCIVDDNGIGRCASKELTVKENTSFGSNLINELIVAINSYDKWRIAIQYLDKQYPETGTTVMITIKYL